MENPVMTEDKPRQIKLDYLLILAKHSRRIILTSAAVTVLVYLILFIKSNEYTAAARILPPEQNLTMSGQILDSLSGAGGGAGGGSGAMGSMGGIGGIASLLGIKSPGEFYVSLLTSETVLDRIIARFNLMDDYGAKYIEDARRKLIGKAQITAGKKDGIILILVTADTPQQAEEMANAFVEELDGLLQRLAVSQAKGQLAFLEKERLQTSQNLSMAEDLLRNFSEKNSVLQIDAQTRGVLEYIARLRAEIDSKEVGIQVMRQQVTPLNSDMIRLETEVKGLRDKLRTAETQYDNCLTDVCLPTNRAPGLALEYVRLYREVKFQEALYQLYIKLVEISRLDMVRDSTIMKVQVVDRAKPPQKRSNKRLFSAIGAGLVAFFIMAGVAISRERLDNLTETERQRLSLLKDHLKQWKDLWIRVKKIFNFRKRL